MPVFRLGHRYPMDSVLDSVSYSLVFSLGAPVTNIIIRKIPL